MLIQVFFYEDVQMSVSFNRRRRNRTVTYTWSFGIGSFLATCISWSLNHSIPWAIFHMFCGWWYVAYYVLFA